MVGHVERVGAQRFDLVVEVSRRPRRRRRRRVEARTQRDARSLLREFMDELRQELRPDAATMTVGDYLRRWLADAEPRLSPTTFAAYGSIVEVHLVPALGERLLRELHPLDVQAYYARKLREPRAPHPKRAKAKPGHGKASRGRRKDAVRLLPLSPTTVRHHRVLLRAALEDAVRLRLLPMNPADPVAAPRRARSEMRALTPSELRRCVELFDGNELSIVVLLAATTGMRRSELLGLRWRDVDFRRRLLHVRQVLVYGPRPERRPMFKDTKTRASRRTVTLPQVALAALRAQQKEQARRRELLPGVYVESGLVCDSYRGGPIRPDSVSDAFARKLRGSDLPRVRFHDLRHSHATALIAAGVHPKVVADRLGHGSVSTTMDLYGHALPEMQQASANIVDDVFGHAAGTERPAAPANLEERRARKTS